MEIMTEILATNIIPSSRIYGDLWGGGVERFGGTLFGPLKNIEKQPHMTSNIHCFLCIELSILSKYVCLQ